MPAGQYCNPAHWNEAPARGEAVEEYACGHIATADRVDLAEPRHARAENARDRASTDCRKAERGAEAVKEWDARSSQRAFASGDRHAEDEQRGQ